MPLDQTAFISLHIDYLVSFENYLPLLFDKKKYLFVYLAMLAIAMMNDIV